MPKKKISQSKPKKDCVKVRGKVTHRVNGKIVKVEENSIHADLLSYFADSMDTDINKAILAASLFTAAEVAPGGAEDGNHGLAFFDNTGGVEDWFTFDTLTGVPTQSNGKRWTGTVTVSQTREVNQVAVGHSFQAGTPPFDTSYATQGFTSINLQAGATYDIDWELYIE